jgi:hypothetical protein
VRPETRLRRAPDCVAESVGDEVVVWLGADRTLHLLDPSGALVWAQLEHPVTAGDVVRKVTDQVAGDPAVVGRDVLAFLAEMTSRSLLVTP